MKIGFYTSTLGDRPFDEVAAFARDAGFDAIEIDVRNHVPDPAKLGTVVDTARKAGLEVSSITFFGNQLDPDPTARAALHSRTSEIAAATAAAGVPALVIFPGRDPTVAEEENYKVFAGFAEKLLDETRSSGLKVLMENWPGPNRNFIATTPAGWRRLFDLVPDTRLALEFDPSHLIWQGIEPLTALRGVRDRIGIIHAKDTAISEAELQDLGNTVGGWWRYALPGRGRLDWGAFLGLARELGFDGIVSVEHEDRDFGWPKGDLAARKEGHAVALKYLRDRLRQLAA